MTNSHETAFIRSFVTPRQKRRLLELMSTPIGSRKFRQTLVHSLDLLGQYAETVPPERQNRDDILRMLHAHGAGNNCYVISESARLDGKTLALEDALDRVVGHGMGTVLSCIAGRLAYYEGEEPNTRLILKRND